jgi:hypothetical protein
VPARFRDHYTPAEDAEIVAADGARLAALAEQWGRTTAALTSRRTKLRRSGVTPRPPLVTLQPLAHRPRSLGPNFARPAFFESEDLGKIALARR